SIERSVIKRDGNDTRSPLDLRRVRLVHAGPHIDQFFITAWNPVTNLELDPVHHGNLLIGFDVNNKPRHFEFVAYLFARPSGLRGVLYDPREQTASPVVAARLGPRSFRIDIPLRLIGNPINYRFAAFGFYAATPCARHACTDAAPNALPLPVQ